MKKYVLIASFFCATFLPIFIVSAGGGSSGGGRKKDPPPSINCDNVRTRTGEIILQFPFDYTGRTHFTIPESLSDPEFYLGGTSLLESNNIGTFFCVITVTGGQCSNYNERYVWNVQSRTMEIPIPTFTSYTLSVNFYERCGDWDANLFGFGNPHYTYSRYFQQEEINYFVGLKYFRTARC